MKVRLGVALLTIAAFVLFAGTALSAPPPAPVLLAPANAASVTVPFTISWSQVLDPAAPNGGYNWQVSRTTAFSATSIVIQNATAPAITQAPVSGLPSGTYFWRVNAVNTALETSAWSAARSFTITGSGAGAPGTPVLNPALGGTTQFHPMEAIRITWSAAAGAGAYVLEASQNSTFPVEGKLTVDNISTTNDGLMLNASLAGTWFVRVYAVNTPSGKVGDTVGGVNVIAGLPSNTITFSVLYGNPVGPPPAQLTPASGATLTLPAVLTWADGYNPQDLGYEVVISQNSSFGNCEPLQLSCVFLRQTSTTASLTTLASGVWFWRLRSTQGDSSPTTIAATAWSPTRSFTISSAPAVVSSLTFTRNPVHGGAEQTAIIQLTALAPSGGAVVALTSSNPGALPLVATMTIPAGVSMGSAPTLQAGQVTVPTAVTVTATYNGSSTSTTVTVLPPTLRTDTLQSSLYVTGGVASVSGSVGLAGTGLAPAGGVTVNISSSSPAANPPVTVTIAAGQNAGGFAIPTSAVTVATPVTITASYAGVTAQWTITVAPQQAPASLTLDRTFTTGGQGASGTVAKSLAPDGRDVQFALSSSNPAVASVPAYVTAGGWAAAAGFFVWTTNPAMATDVVITVTGAGVTKSVTLTVAPVGAPQSPAGTSFR